MEFFLKKIDTRFVFKTEKMALLFSPIQIRGIELKNRLVISPMCQYSSIDGFANDWHLVHLGSYAVGGAALVFTEAASVSPQGRITADDLGIWKDEHVPFLKRITEFIKNNGSVSGIQLAHAGRKASQLSPWKGRRTMNESEGAWQVEAPSAIPYSEEYPFPKEMSKEDIQQTINDFGNAAKRSVEAGFDVIEIHGAHGYLLNEFMSPISNHRTDKYGGSFENRVRLLLEVVQEIRANIQGSMPLFVRISATDWVEGGWNENDSVELAAILQTLDVDILDCSSGGNSHDQKIDVKPLYQVPFSEKVKEETQMKTGTVGLITTAEQAENILHQNQADLIIVARQFLRDPYFALHAARDLGVDVPWPVQYDRAKHY